jgi:Na+/H+ antiporter NhaA
MTGRYVLRYVAILDDLTEGAARSTGKDIGVAIAALQVVVTKVRVGVKAVLLSLAEVLDVVTLTLETSYTQNIFWPIDLGGAFGFFNVRSYLLHAGGKTDNFTVFIHCDKYLFTM